MIMKQIRSALQALGLSKHKRRKFEVQKPVEDTRPEQIKFLYDKLKPIFNERTDMLVISQSSYDLAMKHDAQHNNWLKTVSPRVMIWDKYLGNMTIVRAGYGHQSIPSFLY